MTLRKQGEGKSMNTKTEFTRKPLVLAIGAALAGTAPVALAQDGADELIEEIQVTATRRVASSHDIPFNISAITGSEIEAANILDSTELLRAMPGVIAPDGGERLAENNNAAVNQLDEARADLDMTIQEIRRAEVAVAQTRRRIDQTRVLAPFSGVSAQVRTISEISPSSAAGSCRCSVSVLPTSLASRMRLWPPNCCSLISM